MERINRVDAKVSSSAKSGETMGLYKPYCHNPPHLFRPAAKYFITAGTCERAPFFRLGPAKEKLLDSIFKGYESGGWIVEDWVILDNHYHLMVEAPDDSTGLTRIIQEIHKFTAMWVKKHLAGFAREERIWHNYWDTCVSFEKSYFSRLNYIWHNPVKHRYVEDASLWQFGSYCFRMRSNREALTEIENRYPCDNVHVPDDY